MSMVYDNILKSSTLYSSLLDQDNFKCERWLQQIAGASRPPPRAKSKYIRLLVAAVDRS